MLHIERWCRLLKPYICIVMNVKSDYQTYTTSPLTRIFLEVAFTFCATPDLSQNVCASVSVLPLILSRSDYQYTHHPFNKYSLEVATLKLLYLRLESNTCVTIRTPPPPIFGNFHSLYPHPVTRVTHVCVSWLQK